MPFEAARVQAILVDSYSTLLDVDSAADALRSRLENADAVARLWRAESLNYAMLCNFYGLYEPFYELNRHALDFALRAHGVALPDRERDEILSIYHHLDVFPDVRSGLQRLRELGFPIWVLSNGDPAMLRSLVQLAGIEEVLSGVISVEEIRRYKPALDLYEYAARERARVPAANIVHVSAAWFDVGGAQRAGMQGIWMNRKNEPPRSFGPAPDRVVPDFDGVVTALAR
jgi:2-haloacid dehalogenase